MAMTSPRPPLRVVVNVGAYHELPGSLVLLFKVVVESQVSVGASNGAVVDANQIMTLGTSQISLLSMHWQVLEHISDPLGSAGNYLAVHSVTRRICQ